MSNCPSCNDFSHMCSVDVANKYLHKSSEKFFFSQKVAAHPITSEKAASAQSISFEKQVFAQSIFFREKSQPLLKKGLSHILYLLWNIRKF